MSGSWYLTNTDEPEQLDTSNAPNGRGNAMGLIEGVVLTALGFFFAWLAYWLVFTGVMEVVKLLTGYDWQRKGMSRAESWTLFAVGVIEFVFFVRLLS